MIAEIIVNYMQLIQILNIDIFMPNNFDYINKYVNKLKYTDFIYDNNKYQNMLKNMDLIKYFCRTESINNSHFVHTALNYSNIQCARILASRGIDISWFHITICNPAIFREILCQIIDFTTNFNDRDHLSLVQKITALGLLKSFKKIISRFNLQNMTKYVGAYSYEILKYYRKMYYPIVEYSGKPNVLIYKYVHLYCNDPLPYVYWNSKHIKICKIDLLYYSYEFINLEIVLAKFCFVTGILSPDNIRKFIKLVIFRKYYDLLTYACYKLTNIENILEAVIVTGDVYNFKKITANSKCLFSLEFSCVLTACSFAFVDMIIETFKVVNYTGEQKQLLFDEASSRSCYKLVKFMLKKDHYDVAKALDISVGKKFKRQRKLFYIYQKYGKIDN